MRGRDYNELPDARRIVADLLPRANGLGIVYALFTDDVPAPP